jgi:hypothetical protein
VAIISYKHGFIFVKTTKTAGTSLEVHLSRYCDDEDVVTPINPPIHGHVARNSIVDGKSIYYNHLSAREIRNALGTRFGRFFVFCFERHPVDKCLSHYAMLKNSAYHRLPGRPQSWDAYLDRGDFPLDTDRYTDSDDTLMVDRIYRYEQIDYALRDISTRIPIPYAPLTTREKHGFRHGVPSFEDVMHDHVAKKRIFCAFESSLRFTPY